MRIGKVNETRWLTRTLLSLILFCSNTPAFSDDISYLVQYELSFGTNKTASGLYFGLQRQANIDQLESYNGLAPTPRIPLFQNKSLILRSDESGDQKKGILSPLGTALIAGTVIAASYFYYKDCAPEDSLAGKC